MEPIDQLVISYRRGEITEDEFYAQALKLGYDYYLATEALK